MGEGRANRGGRLKKAKWFDHLPEITVDVECSGTNHRITWRRGKLVLHNHDVEAEEALEALGGEPVYCLSLIDAWREEPQNADSLEILLSEDLDWALQLQPKIAQFRTVLHTLTKGVTTRGRRGTSISTMYERELRRHILFASPYELRKMLGLATVIHVSRKWESDKHFRDEHGPLLEGVLTRRVLPSLESNVQSWNPRMAARAITTFECWPLRSDEEPWIAGSIGTDGGFAIVGVPYSWLIDVWSRGFSLIDDCLVLGVDADPSLGSELRVLAARWERKMGRSVPVLSRGVAVQGSDGVFHLSWGL